MDKIDKYLNEKSNDNEYKKAVQQTLDGFRKLSDGIKKDLKKKKQKGNIDQKELEDFYKFLGNIENNLKDPLY